MTIDMADYAAERGVKFFFFNYTDLFGFQRAKLVPAEAVADIQKSGAGFAGDASYLDMTPAHPDMMGMPDTDSLIQLPWKPEVAWVACDPVLEGEPVAQAPRNVLKALNAKAADMGVMMKSGVEPEFMLINPDGTGLSDTRDIEDKPCYDQSALLRRYDVIAEICTHMISLGWGPYQNDHEDANGQFEMNWDFGPCLQTADQHAFFKFMVKSVAENHGLRATFMPKPFTDLTGNGCHVHHSLWSLDGNTCTFADDGDDMGLSQQAYHFLGGLMEHGDAMCAITNPTVNSYKRINVTTTASGASWSPSWVTYGGNNRTHMVRIPDGGRLEFRLADGASNPYLLQAVLLAAGLDGMERQLDPGPRRDNNMYEDGHLQGAKPLPFNMLDAVRLFDADTKLCETMGPEFSAAYVKMRNKDWAKFNQHLTQWERDKTLDC